MVSLQSYTMCPQLGKPIVSYCEYAVLVSMLEPDSEYYNVGIVDMSYRYPKMYVIRPQFFIPLPGSMNTYGI